MLLLLLYGLYCFQFFILMKLCFALYSYNFLAFRTCIPNQIPSFGPWKSLFPWLSALGFIHILWMWRESHSIVPHLKDLRATKQSFLSFLLTSVCMPSCSSSKPPPRPWAPQPPFCEHHFQQMVTYPNLSGILRSCALSLFNVSTSSAFSSFPAVSGRVTSHAPSFWKCLFLPLWKTPISLICPPHFYRLNYSEFSWPCHVLSPASVSLHKLLCLLEIFIPLLPSRFSSIIISSLVDCSSCAFL